MMSARSSTYNPLVSPRGSEMSATSSTTPNSTRKPAVPRATDLAKLAPKSNKNHIVENRRSAVHLHPPTLHNKDDEGPELHKSFGEIPAYLQVTSCYYCVKRNQHLPSCITHRRYTYVQERKQEWAEAEARRRAAMPDPDCPPGMRLLTEQER